MVLADVQTRCVAVRASAGSRCTVPNCMPSSPANAEKGKLRVTHGAGREARGEKQRPGTARTRPCSTASHRYQQVSSQMLSSSISYAAEMLYLTSLFLLGALTLQCLPVQVAASRLPAGVSLSSFLFLGAATLQCLPWQAAASQLPVVIYHGLGDRFDSPGLADLADAIRHASDEDPTYVYIVRTSNDASVDQRETLFGDMTAQLESVANELRRIDALKDGFNAVGLSQGGVFLRGYLERYNLAGHGYPVMRTLVTMGSPCVRLTDAASGRNARCVRQTEVCVPTLQTHGHLLSTSLPPD